MDEASSTFEASAFHPSLGNEVAVGRIFIDRWQFRFQSEAVDIDIPLARLRVRLGKGDDERIYFHDCNAPEWEIFTTDDSVLDHPYVGSMNNLRAQLDHSASSRELWRRLKILGYVLGGFVVVVWLGQVVASAMARSLVAKVPPALEQALGDEQLAELQKDGGLLPDRKRVARLEALAAPLTSTVKIGTNALDFNILDDDEPNAFAMGGGHVVVTTGLLKLVETPEELLGVIAHEVAHVTERHLLRKRAAAAGFFKIVEMFLSGGSVATLEVDWPSDIMVQQSFSQGYEMEADDVGWQMLVAANIDPRGEIEALKRLRTYEVAQRRLDFGTHAFDSHPALEKRIARLEKKWNKLKKKDGFLDLAAAEKDLRVAAGR
ncbi:MAG: M48 family metallopeptidase [Pedosphaera sp.]|nr:M48 family metallopeptidase [Pedosphaera sp.]